MLAFIIWKLEWMKILFELTLNIEIIIALLEYNCFDYCFQVLFMNVTFEYYCECHCFLLLWIILWILPVLKYYDGQVLNEKLKLIGAVMKFFSKKLLGHETFTSLVLWATKYFLVKPFGSLPPLLHNCTMYTL